MILHNVRVLYSNQYDANRFVHVRRRLTLRFLRRSISSWKPVSSTPTHTGRRSTYHNNPKVTLRQVRKPNLLDSHRLARAPIESPIDRPKSPLAETVAQLLQ